MIRHDELAARRACRQLGVVHRKAIFQSGTIADLAEVYEPADGDIGEREGEDEGKGGDWPGGEGVRGRLPI